MNKQQSWQYTIYSQTNTCQRKMTGGRVFARKYFRTLHIRSQAHASQFYGRQRRDDDVQEVVPRKAESSGDEVTFGRTGLTALLMADARVCLCVCVCCMPVLTRNIRIYDTMRWKAIIIYNTCKQFLFKLLVLFFSKSPTNT